MLPDLEKIRIGLGKLSGDAPRATLMNAMGISGKLVADQLGRSLDVNQNVYSTRSRQSPVESRLTRSHTCVNRTASR